MRTAASTRQLRSIVHVITWGTAPWEFANFSNTDLAGAIMRHAALPPGVARGDLMAALDAERNVGRGNGRRSPDVEAVCRAWFRKADLADQLWPVLQEKVRRDTTGPRRPRAPAERVAVNALAMAPSTRVITAPLGPRKAALR